MMDRNELNALICRFNRLKEECGYREAAFMTFDREGRMDGAVIRAFGRKLDAISAAEHMRAFIAKAAA